MLVIHIWEEMIMGQRAPKAAKKHVPTASETVRPENVIPAGSGRNCRCGSPATQVYSGMDMCSREADARGRYDDSPAPRR